MARFQYKAITRSAETVKGQIEAESAQAATALLAERGLFVDEIARDGTAVEAVEANGTAPKGKRLRLSDKDRAQFVRQLATALQAQLPLMSALQVVGEQNPRASLKALAARTRSIVQGGESLSHAFGHFDAVFDRLHTSMVAVGEASGTLDKSMTQLAQLDENELEIRSNIYTAAIYPAFVLGLGVVSAVIVATWILPRILATIAADAAVLPWPTQVLLAVSKYFELSGIPVILAIVAACWFLARWRRTAAGRYFYDRIELKVPFLARVQRKWGMARFARTLGTLAGGGINILDSLQIVRNTLGNEVLARQVDAALRRVRTGASLAESLRQAGRFEPLLVQIVAVGEETGNLPEMLLAVAEAFDRETQVAIRRFMAIFPALLVLLLALVIGFIVAAALLPIVEIETAIPGF